MKKNVIEPMTVKGMETEKQEGDITMEEKLYTFRHLDARDLFPMFKILSKIGIKELTSSFDTDTVKELAGVAKGKEKNATAIGISIALNFTQVLLANLPKCETEIYEILANTSNLTVNQIKTLDFATFTEMVIDFVKKEEFKDFIKVVLKSFK